MKIKFKRTFDHDHPLPKRKTLRSAGFDLCAAEDFTLWTAHRYAFSTGWAVECPANWCGQIWPRSGLAVDHGVDRLAGLIDEDYRGEIKAVLINTGMMPVQIKKGDRIAQLVFTSYLKADPIEVDELPATLRADGGFGHTGKN